MPVAPAFKTLYKILYWSSLVGLIIVIVLVLQDFAGASRAF